MTPQTPDATAASVALDAMSRQIEQGQHLDALGQLVQLKQDLAALEHALVVQLRRDRASWADIAEVLGVRRQSAWDKYAAKVDGVLLDERVEEAVQNLGQPRQPEGSEIVAVRYEQDEDGVYTFTNVTADDAINLVLEELRRPRFVGRG